MIFHFCVVFSDGLTRMCRAVRERKIIKSFLELPNSKLRRVKCERRHTGRLIGADKALFLFTAYLSVSRREQRGGAALVIISETPASR